MRWPSRWSMLSVALALSGLLLAARPALQVDAGAGHAASADQKPAPPTSVPAPLDAREQRAAAADGQAGASPAATASRPSGARSPAGDAAAPEPAPTTSTTAPMAVPASVHATLSRTTALAGWLEGPISISATYPLGAGGGRSAIARWSSPATLTLRATCDGTSSEASGGSGISVSLVGSSCDLTLEGPSDVVRTTFAIEVG